MSIRLSLVLCLIIICLTWQIQAKCTINTDLQTGPLFVRNFGFKKILMKRNHNIVLEEGESIEGYCSYGFILRPIECCSSAITNVENYAIWRCRNDIATSTITDYKYYQHTVDCLSSTSVEMFQSSSGLNDCLDTTLVIGKKFNTETINIKLAALCFDPDKQKLKFLSFVAHRNTNMLMSEILEPNELDYLRFDKKVFGFDDLFEFMSKHDFDMASDNLKQKYNMYDKDLFEYDSLMQYNTDISSYDNVLNIVWSKRLKNGSWRNFMDGLYMQSVNVKYQVRLGVSGLIELDVTGKCNMTTPLIYQENDLLVNAPKYIWAHLKELKSSNPKPKELKLESEADEFIVIGFNSPYLNLLELTNELTLCPNICEKIPWLNAYNFNKMRLVPLFGVVICCRVEDIIDKLENFPYTPGETFNFTREVLNTETTSTTTSFPAYDFTEDF